MEAEMHIKAITLYGNITRAKKSSIEWKLAERQLTIDFLHKGQIGLVAFFENADLLDCSI
jgi:membrane-bound inhibitor of C-type lysozyme